MRSPLEHDPDLIHGIGLVTVRWAALEKELSSLLSKALVIEPAGPSAYYAIGSFNQRISVVRSTLIGSISEPIGGRIIDSLIDRIRVLWKTRNRLIHSHYVYVQLDWKGRHINSLSGIGHGRELGIHPRERFRNGGVRMRDQDGNEYPQRQPAHQGFAYETYGRDGERHWNIVNKSTFENHAEQVSKRATQVRRITTAISNMDLTLRHGSFWSGPSGKASVRAARNQQRDRVRRGFD